MADQKILLAFHRIDVLKDLSPQSQEILASFSALRTIRKNETLFCESEPSPSCFGVLTGEVTLTPSPTSPALKELGVYPVGKLLGGLSLLRDMPRPGRGSVTQSGELVSIWSSRFRSWVESQSSVAGEPPILGELRRFLILP